MVDDILPMVAVFRHIGIFGAALLTVTDLQIPQRQRQTKFVDLVAGVVDIELTVDAKTRPVKNRSKGIANRAAAGITNMHRPGRVGRDKFNQNPFSVAKSSAAISILLIQNVEDIL